MKPLLNIATVPRDGAVHVVAEGELDLSTAPRLDAALVAAEATDAPMIVVDIDAVSFIDSSGLRMLLAANTRSQRDGNRLRLTRGTDEVRRLFALVDVGNRLPFIDRPASPGPRSAAGSRPDA
ncbi:MAG: hypothetical protein QOF77_1831 [Solirubrobacteraceae bacterium]|jgi:anti-sigma B factor antagonist|nr:hypothetical protein [Solirubrobacteraceae bacterium]